MNTIAVVDYGMGNLRSVAQAVIHAASVVDHAEVIVTSNPQVVRDAHRVVLPGQGAMPGLRLNSADTLKLLSLRQTSVKWKWNSGPLSLRRACRRVS